MTTPTRPAPPPPPVRKGQVQSFEATCNYKAQRDCELSLEEGDLLFIVDRSDPTWWLASLDNKKGYVRSDYVTSDGVKVAIIDAARRGNLDLLDECLAAGVSVNSLDKTGCSALHAASQAGHVNCVTRLLQNPKIELNLQNKLEDTPIHCAAYRGHSEVVQLLLKKGAKIDILNKDNCTPRKLAKKATIISLLEAGLIRSHRMSSSNDDKEYVDSEDSDE